MQARWTAALVIASLGLAGTGTAESWVDKISLYGDFRGRYEGIFFDTDPLGNEKRDRHRARYRLRLGLEAKINETFDVRARLATGPDANSGNQTLGSGNDFDPDGVFLDQAYLTVHPFAGRSIPLGMSRADVIFGKMPNPFRSKVGKDVIVWDGDIMPEGVAVRLAASPSDLIDLKLDAGFYILDENSSSADPHIVAIQLESVLHPTSKLSAGSAISFYAFSSIDPAYLTRGAFAASGKSFAGNIPNGLNGGGSTFELLDARAFLTYDGFESWPITLYGSYTHNFDAVAQPAFAAGEEDDAFSVGLEVGDKKKIVKLGAGYFRVEANAVPANQTDSDLFDGRTNGKGFVAYASRQIFHHTDFNLQFFASDAADKGITHADAVENHDRFRLQADIVIKF